MRGDDHTLRRYRWIAYAVLCFGLYAVSGAVQARPDPPPLPARPPAVAQSSIAVAAPGPAAARRQSLARENATGSNATGSNATGSDVAGSDVAGSDVVGSKRSVGKAVFASRIARVDIPGPRAHIPALGGYIYLPAGYDDPANAAVRYPVLYLFHGTPGWPSDWFQPARAAGWMDTLVGAGAVRPMILVAATANRHHSDDSECLNAVNGPQMETYLTQDVVAYTDGHYRTLPDRGHRGIGGISSGGYCALNLGLRHQDEYAVVLAHMPYGDPGNAADVTHRLLGDSSVLYRQNTPSLYLPKFVFRYPTAFFLDAGSDDPVVRTDAKALARLLTKQHQAVSLRVVPRESHSWRLAREEVPYSLRFASRYLLSP